MLGLHPVLFHSIATFDAVHALASRLTTLYQVVGWDMSEARSYWRELSGDLNKSIAVLAREVERLLKLI